MRLNARMLKNVASVNQWEYANEAHAQEGQVNDIYIQLVDLDKLPQIDKSVVLPEFPLRHIPQYTTSVALEVTFESIDDAAEFSIAGSKPFPQDESIWKFTLSSTQTPQSGNVKFKLTTDGSDKYFLVISGIRVDLLNVGGC